MAYTYHTPSSTLYNGRKLESKVNFISAHASCLTQKEHFLLTSILKFRYLSKAQRQVITDIYKRLTKMYTKKVPQTYDVDTPTGNYNSDPDVRLDALKRRASIVSGLKIA